MGEGLEIENVSRLRKQELMFAIMKKRAKGGEQVFGDGVLEVLPDGFGFLRSIEASYMARTDDIYLSPEPDPPLQPAHRRHGRGRGAGAQGRRALLRAGQGRPRQRRDARGEQAQDHVREPDAAVPEGAVQARARHQERGEHHQPHHRPGRAARQRPARAAGVAAEERQDGDDAAPRARDRRQPPRRAPDRAAGRRAARGSHRDAAHRARRGHQLDLRRTGRAPRAGGRDGDRARQAPGRDEEGRRHPARLDHPAGPRLQQRAALVRARC